MEIIVNLKKLNIFLRYIIINFGFQSLSFHYYNFFNLSASFPSLSLS